jgi:hypothetical protein
MSNALFPTIPGISIERDEEPEFSTKIITSVSKKEYRASLAASPVYNFTLKYNFLRKAKGELDQLKGLFLASLGAFDSFLLDYADDNAVTDQLLGVANGSQTQFQLLRGLGSSFVEPIMNVNTLGNVKVGGVTKTLGTDFTLSSTGMLIFGSAPISGNVTASTSYYYRCRFMEDKLKFNRFLDKIYSAEGVQLRGSLGRKI